MLYSVSFKKGNHPYGEAKRSALGKNLAILQRQLAETRRSLLLVIDGWECSGKGYILNEVLRELDPRYYEVQVFDKPSGSEQRHSYLWRYMMKTPANGQMMIFDRSHYFELLQSIYVSDADFDTFVRDIQFFERLLIADGTLVVKCFLHHSQQVMAKRVSEERRRLAEKPERERLLAEIDNRDAVQLAIYDEVRQHFDRVLEATDQPVPWHLIPMSHRKDGARRVLGLLNDLLADHLAEPNINDASQLPPCSRTPLEKIDLSLSLEETDYRRELKKLQKRAGVLLTRCHGLDIPVICAFEGTDAAGKGGAIRRLTQYMDPRGFDVATTSAPTHYELTHHYLWRFYRDFPEKGRLTIYDRSWYGRVLVERVEGFAAPRRWQEAYDEINAMEEVLTDHGVMMMKFLLVISKEEQLNRFKAREENPEKSHKLTEEDWRNHEKYDDYTIAMNEMVCRTERAVPWHVIPAEDKKYARVRVLEIFNRTLENAVQRRLSKLSMS